ncbi:type I-E CRISPR-associated protein Cse2/CasB [Thalassomonas haliotis]|uniref:Type I-E CRISPR-associated protein Cse2/CasB n=1 Tax=Thalassomonas haliotis TaxID=485448 RepID=A0ABY7VH05_9GAMM|nr:type I-E CRISPR-associated protein Cse2/CasB [Thalassomonas haliotis]WDE12325.1 type I-E CRISPR-associated protein Cse2/CasB [Thalassomonas haliotis]
MNLQITITDKQVLQAWWHWLDDNRGHRAKLRRATSPDDIMMTDAFFRFLKFSVKIEEGSLRLGNAWRDSNNLHAAATLCGLLSKVKEHATEQITIKALDDDNEDYQKTKKRLTFPAQLAMPNNGGSSPIMSELRFSRLQKSESVDSFYLNMSRAISLLNGTVNIESLITDILDWYREFEHGADKEPRKRLAVRWATEYFTTLNYNKLA